MFIEKKLQLETNLIDILLIGIIGLIVVVLVIGVVTSKNKNKAKTESVVKTEENVSFSRDGDIADYSYISNPNFISTQDKDLPYYFYQYVGDYADKTLREENLTGRILTAYYVDKAYERDIIYFTISGSEKKLAIQFNTTNYAIGGVVQ